MERIIYANRFSVTTTAQGEVFLNFSASVPQHDADGKEIGTEEHEGVTVAVSGSGLDALIGVFEEIKDKLNQE